MRNRIRTIGERQYEDGEEIKRLRERVRELEADNVQVGLALGELYGKSERLDFQLSLAMKVLEAARQLATGASLFVFTADYEADFDALDKAVAAYDAAYPSEPVVSQGEPK